MKRENEFAVGLVVIAALALVVGGALWLSGAHLGKTEAVYVARFRTVGGLGVGSPVVLRGVRGTASSSRACVRAAAEVIEHAQTAIRRLVKTQQQRDQRRGCGDCRHRALLYELGRW